ncbi:MAG: hypothetical protein IPI51_13670 [Betaproteobacteria bacterium]|nr:hypothetical protein [Betaproteobacteria bacterium]
MVSILWRLWPKMPAALQIPWWLTGCARVSDGVQAAVLWCCGAERGALPALGGALFLALDAPLATNKFAFTACRRWPACGILGTYRSAQRCIASWLETALKALAGPQRPALMPLEQFWCSCGSPRAFRWPSR